MPALWAAAGAGLAVFLTAAAGGPGDSRSDGYERLYVGLLLMPAALCALRALLVRDQRLPWLACGTGMACFAAGYGYHFGSLEGLPSPPYPSLSDALWLSYYAFSVVGLLLLMTARLSQVRRSLWIDAAVGGLAIATLGGAVLVDPLLVRTGGSHAAVVTNMSYPLFDVLILSLVFAGFVFSNWRPGRVWTLIGVAWTLQAVGDILYLRQATGGTYEFGTSLDAAWPALMLLIAFAAWQKPTVTEGPSVQGWGALVVTIAFAVIGLGVLAYDHWHELHDVAIVMATLTLAAAFVRTAMTFGDMRTLAHGRQLLLQKKLILDAAGEGIIGIDAEGAVTFANPAAARMTQYAPEEMTGRSLHDLLHHTKADGTPYPEDECPLVAACAEGRSRSGADELLWRKDGTCFSVEYTSTPIVDGVQTGGGVVVFRDATERREIQRVKDQFVSVVSHELRTPLTAIRGSLGLLESGVLGPLPDRGQRMIEIAVQNTDRLVRLINDILDLERIDSAAIHLRQAPCDAAHLIARATEAMLPVAAEAGVTLAVDAAPTPFVADADRLIQTLTNLIGNAVKFSPAGSTVQVVAERRGGEIRFDVSDRGRGIPPDKLETIFERFQQVDASDSRRKGGTGLGLAICRSIVEHHGGRIWAQSVAGQGSTLSFTVPAAPREDDAYSPAIGSRDDSWRVLFVADDPVLAGDLRAIFDHHAIKSFAATDGREAIELCRRVLPDLLVLDVDLPEIDAHAVVDWLRHRERLKALPVVVYTAGALGDAARERLRLGSVTQFSTRDQIPPEEFERRLIKLLGQFPPHRTQEARHESEAHPARR